MVKNRIGKLRRENDMNQKELGEKLGVGQTTVSAWETGKNEPDNESMNKMAKLFTVSFGYLAGYADDEKYRGLSKEEHEKAAWAEHYQREEEKRIKQIEQEESNYDQDVEEYLEEELFKEWQEGYSNIYFEFFKLNKYGDYLTKAQREKILAMAELMYPNAVKGQHTPE